VAKNTTNENFSMTYRSSDNGNGDTIADISLSFDNPKDDSVVVTRLNTWLKAIGRDNIEVKAKAVK